MATKRLGNGKERGLCFSAPCPFWRIVGLVCSAAATVVLVSKVCAQPAPSPVAIDVARFDASSGSAVATGPKELRLSWPVTSSENAEITFNLDPAPNQPLIERLAIGGRTVMRRVQPVTLLTIGERDLRAPSGWVAFFDNPPLRSHRTVPAVLKKATVSVASAGASTIVRVGEVTAGSFRGAIEISVFRNSPLIFVETVVTTDEDGRAILYDAGLVAVGRAGEASPWASPESTTYSPLAPGPAH